MPPKVCLNYNNFEFNYVLIARKLAGVAFFGLVRTLVTGLRIM